MAAAALPAHGLALSVATLCCWLFTAAIGAYMLRRVAARGGFRRQRAVRNGLPPGVLVAHFSLALSGLASWVGYLATGWAALAWLGVVLLMPAIGFGICTVTLWTPYPRAPSSDQPTAGGGPPGLLPAPRADAVRGRLTDAMLAQALTDEALAARLIDEVIASLPDASPLARKRRVYPVAVIPFGHGLGAMATFVLAVMSAIGAR